MVGSDTRCPWCIVLYHREVGSHFSLLLKGWFLFLMSMNFGRCNFGLDFRMWWEGSLYSWKGWCWEICYIKVFDSLMPIMRGVQLLPRANHVGRDSNPTNRLLGRWLNGRKPSWPITPVSPGVVGSGSGTPHYCPDVPHAMSNSGLSGSGQWTYLRVPFFFHNKKKKKAYYEDCRL